MNRTRAERRHFRKVKGLRRLIEDRNQHYQNSTCPCLEDEARKGKGKVFSRFADYPQTCSSYCCGNPRRHGGSNRERLTLQEQRAAIATKDESDF